MTTSFAQSIQSAIRAVVGPGPAVLHEPCFRGNEWLYLKECLDSTFVSSVGKFVDRFELDLANFTGAKHVVAVVNGTAALHIALKLAGATFVAGNSNGWLGYFPTRGAYEEGGYEVTPGVWSRVAPGSAELIEAWGKQLLGQLFK